MFLSVHYTDIKYLFIFLLSNLLNFAHFFVFFNYDIVLILKMS